VALGCLASPAPARAQEGLEVRRLGLSRVAEQTLLTVVVNRPANPLVEQRISGGKPQLVVDFSRARAGRLPSRLPGDDLLVEQVRTEAGASQAGVRITLDLFPDRPYTFWRLSRVLDKEQAVFMLGLKADPTAPRTARLVPSRPAAPEELREGEPETGPVTPAPRGEREPAVSGSFAELRQLIPQASPLLQGLEAEGWVVAESHHYDRPGTRFSRDFLLTNSRYPELVVKIAHLPANVPGTPSINIVTLALENLGGEDANKYRQLRQWRFSQIKQHYEDIGDFFDEALKPLRVKLRRESQELIRRQSGVWQSFLQRACPGNPRVAQEVMKHVQEKVNQRFEGVQYTMSEEPLVILNLVDFPFVRVYYLEAG
jgi:hypothetical protein